MYVFHFQQREIEIATMMKEDYEEAMRQQQLQEEEKYKSSIQYQEELERQLEEQVS